MTPDRASPESAVADILDSLRRSRAFLLDPSPQNIDCCGIVMGRCAVRMAALLEDRDLASQTKLADSIELVRHELDAIAGLLASAAAFRRDLIAVMRAATPTPAIPANTGIEKAQRVHVLC